MRIHPWSQEVGRALQGLYGMRNEPNVMSWAEGLQRLYGMGSNPGSAVRWEGDLHGLFGMQNNSGVMS